ncbi:MAG TPA: MFS transporter [Vicinamibacterales bacterium]|jgi:MFS family permease|nr:MFS transporter [Vicinamibacterales bacterium]
MSWWSAASQDGRRALIAASLGWMLDAMDVLIYSLVLNDVRREFGIDDRASGILLALPLATSAFGGMFFGWLADRFGRTRALMASILWYSIFTAACGLSQTVFQLGMFRALLGFGFGGEWAIGAALVAETWPAEHRGKALGFMQSAWAVGYAAASLVTAIVLPRWGWRAVFFAGILPALATVWIRRSVAESRIWRESRTAGPNRVTLAALVRGELGRLTWLVAAMNAATMFAWWGLFTWIPSFLGRPVEEGGAGLSILRTSTWIILMQVGMWLGYVTFGFIADWIGRKRSYVAYLLTAAVLVPIYGATREPAALLALGPLVAFFGTGYFSGFGAVSAELFPTSIRATAQGITYNLGRGISAVAPFVVGSLATSRGLGAAFSITSTAFLVAAVCWIWIPETKGRALS